MLLANATNVNNGNIEHKNALCLSEGHVSSSKTSHSHVFSGLGRVHIANPAFTLLHMSHSS